MVASFVKIMGLVGSTNDACDVARWPGVQPSWHHGGASEQCFCAYAMTAPGATPDDDLCPSWKTYVSTDNNTANKLSRSGAALVQGNYSLESAEKYGSMTDWAVDLGSGYGADCDVAKSPGCDSVGAHALSIPKDAYYDRCCDAAAPYSLAFALESDDPAAACGVLRDLVRGGLDAVAPLSGKHCDEASEEPTANGAGLGPAFNGTEAESSATHGYDNVCVCEPAAARAFGRGHCPDEAPAATDAYARLAALALCRNVAGAAGIPASRCDACG
ncbi:hypothetical protein JL722_14916 [Aureococcus anophagefferens]|nr:hypothetical protein JL722_14916 [Aureococcus anophagefferens]